MTRAITAERLEAMDAYWRAANYLTVGQIRSCASPCDPSTSSPVSSATGALPQG